MVRRPLVLEPLANSFAAAFPFAGEAADAGVFAARTSAQRFFWASTIAFRAAALSLRFAFFFAGASFSVAGLRPRFLGAGAGSLAEPPNASSIWASRFRILSRSSTNWFRNAWYCFRTSPCVFGPRLAAMWRLNLRAAQVTSRDHGEELCPSARCLRDEKLLKSKPLVPGDEEPMNKRDTKVKFTIGAFAIIPAGEHGIVLCHRTDMNYWNFPGGAVESGEAP